MVSYFCGEATRARVMSMNRHSDTAVEKIKRPLGLLVICIYSKQTFVFIQGATDSISPTFQIKNKEHVHAEYDNWSKYKFSDPE